MNTISEHSSSSEMHKFDTARHHDSLLKMISGDALKSNAKGADKKKPGTDNVKE